MKIIKHVSRIAFFAIIALLLQLMACQGQEETTAVPPPQEEQVRVATSEKLDPDAFWDKYQNTAGAILIDVRTPAEVAEGKIPGAIMIDFRGDNFEAELDKLDTEVPTFVYCKAGGRSGQTAAMMERKGFIYVADLKGGMTAWNKAGKPTE